MAKLRMVTNNTSPFRLALQKHVGTHIGAHSGKEKGKHIRLCQQKRSLSALIIPNNDLKNDRRTQTKKEKSKERWRVSVSFLRQAKYKTLIFS